MVRRARRRVEFSLVLRVVSLNVNGIRSAARKGLFKWLATQKADIVCMQEIKALESDLEPAVLAPKNYSGAFLSAQKKGYSGVAVYARRPPDALIRGFGSREFDAEGRYLEARFGKLSVVSVYLPSGASSEVRLAAKFRFLDEFLPQLRALARSGREVVLCGDWNIAHKEIDLKNWKSNQKNSGFLPEERAWLSTVFDDVGLVDVFRRINRKPEQYTWWSNRGQAWAKNVGWRIDYQIATPELAAAARKVSIHTRSRFSDHAPLTIDYDWDF